MGLCNSHKDLIVWQKVIKLAGLVHRAAAGFPVSERFALASQVRRSAVSVASNIAEGSARRTTREYIAFLHIARGSLAELETQLLLAQDFAYLDEAAAEEFIRQTEEVGRLLTAVIAGLRRRLCATSSRAG